MEKVQEYLNKGREKLLIKQETFDNDKEIQNFENLKKEYIIWIQNLNYSMHLCQYRKVLKEIEYKKKNFIQLKSENWRYKAIQLKAIMKIIRKKMLKYQIEMTKENSRHFRAVLFWFNFALE